MILPPTLSSNTNNLTKNSTSSPTASSISLTVSSTDSKSNPIININMNGSPISSSSIPMHPVAATSSSSTTSCSEMPISPSSTAGGSMTPSATTTNTTSNDNNKTTSTANSTSIVVDCAGCGSTIMDRYYLSAVDQHWHVSCLKCSQCKVNLQAEPSCFSRDGLIFCKSDYYRLFTMRRCSRCGEGIYASELVMRVKDHNVYHIQCFTCAWCNSTLAQGDLFGIRDNLVYCRQHYEMLSSTSTTAINNSNNNISSSCPTSSLLTNNVPPPTKISPIYSLGVMAPSDVLHRHNHHHHDSSPSPSSSSPPPPPPPQPPLGQILPGHHPFHHLHHHSAHHHTYLNHHPSQSVHHLGHPPPPHHHHHHHSHHHGQTGSSPPPPTMLIHDTHLTGDQCSTMAATPYTTSNTGNLPGGSGGSALYSPLNLANLSIAGGTGSGGRMTPNGPITSNNNNNPNNGQSPTTPQSIRKGRPRKRKSVMNNHHNNQTHHNTNNNHNHHLSSQQQQQQQDNETIVNSCSHETNTMSPQSGRNTHSPSGVSNTLDGGGPLSGLAASIENSCNSQLSSSSNSALNLATHHQGSGSNGGGQRTKRMRTSFKHHQLRTMKTYFSVNQNPDAKDLKQLAQKTGLSKRVLQVWFQNARAKWRRNNLKMLPDATELSLNGQTMLNLGHPSTPSSTVVGSPNGSTRPYSSPSPVMSPSTTDTSQLSQQHHQQQPPPHDHSPMMIPSLQHPGCATTPNSNNNNNNNSPVSSNLKTTPTFLNGPHGPPPPLPPPVPSSMPLQPPNIAISMNFQELY